MKWLAMLALVTLGCGDAANTQLLPIGSRCSSSGQCGTPPFDCNMSGYPDGYCEKPCVLDGDCPGDSVCEPGAKSCRRTCSTTSDCRFGEGYACVPLVGSHSICQPSPTMDGGTT